MKKALIPLILLFFINDIKSQKGYSTFTMENNRIIQTCDQEFDPSSIDDNLLLKVDFSDQIIDDSGNDFSITNNNVELAEDRFFATSSGSFGAGRFLELGNQQKLKPNFPMSFSFWVFPEELGLNRNYIYTSDLQLDKRAGFAIQTLTSNNKIHFFYSDEMGCYNPACRRGKVAELPLPLYEWTHVVINAKSFDSIDIYYDGCLVPSYANGSGDVNLHYSEFPSFMGFADNSNQSDSQRSYFGGKIDDFHFWDRSISEDEILYLYDRFEIPELDIEQVYTIPLNDNLVEITLDNIFEDVIWSDGQMSNTASFTEEGNYEVEAFYDCHLICAAFEVSREDHPFVQTCDQEFDGSNLDQNLLLHFNLDGNTQDSGPNIIHGINNGGVNSFDRFQEQNAYSFNGSSNIIIPHNDFYKVQFPITVSTWVKWESNEPQNNAVFSTNFEQDNYHGLFMLRIASTGQLFFGYGTGTGGITLQNRRAVISDTETELNTWYHIVGTINGPNDFQLFVNGCEESYTYTGDENPIIAYNGNDGFLGRLDNSNNVPSNDLIGSIDDFYFWNRIISEEEILYLYDRFEIPELVIEQVYTIPLNDNLVEITIDNIFKDVVWSDQQTGNAATFTEEGNYEVEAFFDCHLVCSSFSIEKEIVLPPVECEFFQKFNGHCGSSQYKCVLAEEFGGPKYYVEGEITIPSGYDLCSIDLNENVTSSDEIYIFEQTRVGNLLTFRAFVTVKDNNIFEANGSEMEFSICDENEEVETCLTYSLPAGDCRSDYNCTIDYKGLTRGSDHTIDVNYCMVLHELDMEDCTSGYDLSVLMTNATDMIEIYSTTISENLDQYQCISIPITIEQFMDQDYGCMELIITNSCAEISCSRFDCNLLSTTNTLSDHGNSIVSIENTNVNHVDDRLGTFVEVSSATDQDEISIYPVPTNQTLYVEAKKEDKLSLMDLNGRKISLEFKFSENRTQLDLSQLLNGMYYLVIERENAILDIRKVIKTN